MATKFHQGLIKHSDSEFTTDHKCSSVQSDWIRRWFLPENGQIHSRFIYCRWTTVFTTSKEESVVTLITILLLFNYLWSWCGIKASLQFHIPYGLKRATSSCSSVSICFLNFLLLFLPCLPYDQLSVNFVLYTAEPRSGRIANSLQAMEGAW